MAAGRALDWRATRAEAWTKINVFGAFGATHGRHNKREHSHASRVPGGYTSKFQSHVSFWAYAGARDGVNAALKAMSTWRNEMADTNEKNGKHVIEKMAAAAAAVGWPDQVVDAARTQLQSIAEIQIKTMDQLMDAWEEQIKLPNAMTASPSAMLSKLESIPGFASTGSGLSAEDFQKAATNPIQLWIQLAEQ